MAARGTTQRGRRPPAHPAPRESAGASAFTHGYTSGRMATLFMLFAVLAVLFVGRLYWLTVGGDSPTHAQWALEERQVSVAITPSRGTIYDRNGNVLASSVEASTVYCNPREVEDAQAAAKAVADALGGSPDDYLDALTQADTSFAYLKRQVDMDVAQKLRDADIGGIYFAPDSKRVYPNGAIAGQVLGLVNIDGEGITGLELQYDEVLGGTPGELSYELGANGMVIAGTETRTEAVPGQDIVISIDIDLQQRVERDVAAFAKENKAKSGQGLVLDGATGEILACASTPFLDPTNITEIEDHATEAQCITRAFEPGSIFKTVTMCGALEEGAITPSSTIFCPSELPADEYVVTDAFERTSTTMSATEILARSSNVGISLIGEKMGFDVLNEKIAQYGLDDIVTGVDYPGESGGYLLDFDSWSRIQGYNICFGQGISETPLQMARFYGAIVNDGVACTPHFLVELPQGGEEPQWQTRQIIQNTQVLPELRQMLIQVVQVGTATDAQIPGFDAAGKTGTGEYIAEGHEEDGYLTDHYNVSFVGFLANTDSKLVCFVGGAEVPGEPATTAVFQDIMTYAIERYNINPTQG